MTKLLKGELCQNKLKLYSFKLILGVLNISFVLKQTLFLVEGKCVFMQLKSALSMPSKTNSANKIDCLIKEASSQLVLPSSAQIFSFSFSSQFMAGV